MDHTVIGVLSPAKHAIDSSSGNGPDRITRRSGLHFVYVDVNWVQRVACIDSALCCRQYLLFECSDPPEIGWVVVDRVFLGAHTASHRSGSVASQARGINRPWPIGSSTAGRCDSGSHTP